MSGFVTFKRQLASPDLTRGKFTQTARGMEGSTPHLIHLLYCYSTTATLLLLCCQVILVSDLPRPCLFVLSMGYLFAEKQLNKSKNRGLESNITEIVFFYQIRFVLFQD